MLTIGNEHFIRCVNCWMLHSGRKSILEHWNHGSCLFYCSVCGKSFHDNIKEIRPHFLNAHGIRFRAPHTVGAPKAKRIKYDVSKIQPTTTSGLYKCPVCDRELKNRQALSCHLTLSHNRKKICGPTTQQLLSGNLKDEKIIKRTANSTKNKNVTITTKANAMNKQLKIKNVKMSAVSTTVSEDVQNALKKVSTTGVTIISTKSKQVPQSIQNKNSSDADQLIVTSTVKDIHQNQISISNQCEDINIIKSEPVEEMPEELYDSYVEMSPPHFNGWTQSDCDDSPRLKVKNITDLQDPKQMYSMNTPSYIHTQNQTYKDNNSMLPNGTQSDLQIQNVQSYRTHSTHPIQQQTCINYPCGNPMESNVNIPDNLQSHHTMCASNLYDMHISQAQQVQSTQLINPVFLLQSSSPQDYHY